MANQHCFLHLHAGDVPIEIVHFEAQMMQPAAFFEKPDDRRIRPNTFHQLDPGETVRRQVEKRDASSLNGVLEHLRHGDR